MGARSPQAMAAAAKRHVDRAHFANNCVFAYYRLHPIKLKPRYRIEFEEHKALLRKIAPWLPKHIPKWMLPQS